MFDVLYVNQALGQNKKARYTPNQVIKRLYSDEIVTVDKKNKTRYQFISFGFVDGQLVINYNPIIW